MYAFLFDRKSATLTIALFLAFLSLLFWAGLALGSRVGPELAKRGTAVQREPEPAAEPRRLPASTAPPALTIPPLASAPAAAPAPVAPAPVADTPVADTPTTDTPDVSAMVQEPAPVPAESHHGRQQISDSASAAAESDPVTASPSAPMPRPDANDTAAKVPSLAPKPPPSQPSSPRPATILPIPAPRVVSRIPVEAPAAQPTLGKQAPMPRAGADEPAEDPGAVAPHPTDSSPDAGLPGEIPAAKQQASDLVRSAHETAATPTSRAGQRAATATRQAPSKAIYSVQVGAFSREANARQRAEILKRAGYQPFVQAAKTPRGRSIHTVRIGHYESKQEALDAAADFAAREGTPAIVRWQDQP